MTPDRSPPVKLEVPETVEASTEARCVTVASFLFAEVVQLHIRVTHLTRVFLLPRCQNLGSSAWKGQH